MATPSNKSPGMEKTLDKITQGIFGRPRTESINNDVCVTCHNDASVFRDVLSRKEYKISGMCQYCQDSVFGVES